MRIKRTDKDFTVMQKAGRKIHYAGQGKKYTEHTVNFSPKEKQDALRQKNLSGAGTGIQAQMQRQSNADRDAGDFFADDTAKSYQQEQGNSVGGRSGNKSRNPAVSGNLHIKRPRQEYPTESVSHGEQLSGNGQPEQQQYQHQQIQRPSAYHENTIKTKEPVLHRKSDVPSGIKRVDDFSLKERKEKKEKSQKTKLSAASKAYRGTYAGESQQEKSEILPTANKTGNPSADGYAQSFSDRRDRQVSNYKRRKFFRSGKEKYSRKAGYENTGREADTSKSTGTSQLPEAYRMEAQPLQMQGTGESALLQKQDNLPAGNTSTSHIKKRNAGDSIRQRDKDISGRKDKAGRKDKKSKKDKGKNKDAKRDNSRSNFKNRKDRAAALRLLSYASDKFSQEEQKDSLLKVAGDLLVGKVKAAVAGKLLSVGAALLPALIPTFVMILIITPLFNSHSLSCSRNYQRNQERWRCLRSIRKISGRGCRKSLPIPAVGMRRN